MLLSLILFVVMTIVAAYFASNNLTKIDVNVLGHVFTATTGVWMVTALGIGVLLGVIIMLPALISRSWTVLRHRRKIQDLQDQQIRQAREYTEDEEEAEDQ